MNFTYPFSYCKCDQRDANNFEQPLDGHCCITAEDAAHFAHACPEVHYFARPRSRFFCPLGAACKWAGVAGEVTSESVAKFEAELSAMEPAAAARARHTFAMAHNGFDFLTPPMVYYKLVATDPLDRGS